MLILIAMTWGLLSAMSQDHENSLWTNRGAHAHSNKQGVCAFTVHADSRGPLAVFGVYKTENDSSRYGYLVLFEPGKKGKEPCKIQKNFDSGRTTESSTDVAGEMKWGNHQLKIKWNFSVDERTGRVDQNEFMLNGKQHGRSGSRLFVASVVDGKLKVEPIKAKLPSKVPDVTDTANWTRTIQQAIQEAKNSSPEIAKLLN